eukprot:SAG11_NODE_3835_length_2196_cov_1.650453_3_plen_81_part_00
MSAPPPPLTCQRDSFEFGRAGAGGGAPPAALTYLNCAYLGPLPTASKLAAQAVRITEISCSLWLVPGINAILGEAVPEMT